MEDERQESSASRLVSYKGWRESSSGSEDLRRVVVDPVAEVVILSNSLGDRSVRANVGREGGVPPPGEVTQRASPTSGTSVVAS